MQLPQCIGILDRDLRRELPTAPAGADHLTARAAVDVPTPLELDQVAAVAEDDIPVEQLLNRRHRAHRFDTIISLTW